MSLQADTEITLALVAKYFDDITAIVAEAAAATMTKPLSAIDQRIKPDSSPVTAADEASEAIIVSRLSRIFPNVPIVAEESVSQSKPSRLTPSFFSVDPLDGTREFLAGRDEFTVNVAVVTDGTPIAGIIAAPAQGLLWRGVVDGGGAERFKLHLDGTPRVDSRTTIRTRKAPERLTVATSRTHLDETTEAYVSRLSLTKRYPCGSSIKFCHLAQGDADLYPRLAPTSEWDIAAGQAIVLAAGGVMTTPQGEPVAFGQSARKFLVPGFLAWGDPERAKAAVR